MACKLGECNNDLCKDGMTIKDWVAYLTSDTAGDGYKKYSVRHHLHALNTTKFNESLSKNNLQPWTYMENRGEPLNTSKYSTVFVNRNNQFKPGSIPDDSPKIVAVDPGITPKGVAVIDGSADAVHFAIGLAALLYAGLAQIDEIQSDRDTKADSLVADLLGLKQDAAKELSKVADQKWDFDALTKA
jgi:hypothetical protein